jgi:arginyl-tRNA synthetase
LISDVEGAKLVDLEKWKLGKAVLRKKGVLVSLYHRCLISQSFRWDIYLFDP